MFALMLVVVFVLVLFSISFVIQFIDAIKNGKDFDFVVHVLIICAAITFIVGYFTY